MPCPAAFYVVLGGLYFKADSWLLERGDQATEAAYRRINLGTMCLSFGWVHGRAALLTALHLLLHVGQLLGCHAAAALALHCCWSCALPALNHRCS